MQTVNKLDPRDRRSRRELSSTRTSFVDERSGSRFFEPLTKFVLFTLILVSTSAHATSLLGKQNLFATLTARLILRAQEMGYQVSLGEAWRSSEVAAFQTRINAEKGIGIAASLHTKRLALDLNLFHNGKYLAASNDYTALGKWWEAQSTGQIQCRWGGRFRRADGNHFSIEHEGIQ